MSSAEIDVVAGYSRELFETRHPWAVVAEPEVKGLAANQDDSTARERGSDELERIVKLKRRLGHSGRERFQ
ncbi:MAG TPA: hypothetical protein VJN18_25040 [Polyangiaceae bacterium]|nr:hypothetical protein [Polyangiaceae bacterium]